jgi:hypothetical protein
MVMYAAVGIAVGVLNPHRNRRANNAVRNGCLSSENERLALRLQPYEVHTLAIEFVNWPLQSAGRHTSYHTSLKMMKVFLHYLARGGYYHQLGRSEGIAESTAMVYLHEVAAYFQQTANRYVSTC